MRFPCIIVTTKLPAIIKLDALLRALRLHCPANIIKLLPIDTDRCLKHSHFVRRPSLYARFPRDSLPNGETGMSSDDSCPRSFARSNRYCMPKVEMEYQLGVVESVRNRAARVVDATDAAEIVLHLLPRLPEILAVVVRVETFYVLELGPGLRVEVCGRMKEGRRKVRRESEQSRQMLDSGFLSEASLRSCFLDLEEGASEGSWWLEDSSAGEKDGGRLRDLRLSLEWWLLSAFDDSFS